MSRISKTVITALAIVIAASGAYAQNATSQAFSVKQAQDFALENAFSAKSYALGVDQARTVVNEAISMGLLQVNGSADFQNFMVIPTTVLPNFVGQAISAQIPNVPPGPEYIQAQFGTKYNFSVGANARQQLFDPTWIIGVQGAKMYLEKIRNMDKKNDQDVAGQIEQAYYTVLVSQRSKELIEKNLANLEKTLAETTEYYKNGFVEESSVDQLSLIVSNLKTSQDKAARQTEIVKNLLKFQMGYDMDKEIELTENLESLWLVNNHEALMTSKLDVTKNVNYYIADLEITLRGYQVKLEKAKYLPTLGAFVNYSVSAQRNEFNFFAQKPWFNMAVWGINLRMPIFDSFMKAATTKRAKLEVQRVTDMKTFTEQQLKLQETSARSNYISAFEQLRAEEANIKLAESIRNKTIIKFNEGVANSTELTQTETQLLNTQGAYIGSLFQLLNAKAELSKVLVTY